MAGSTFRYRLALVPNNLRVVSLCLRSKTLRGRKNWCWHGETPFRRSPGNLCLRSRRCSVPRSAMTSVDYHFCPVRLRPRRMRYWCISLPAFHCCGESEMCAEQNMDVFGTLAEAFGLTRDGELRGD